MIKAHRKHRDPKRTLLRPHIASSFTQAAHYVFLTEKLTVEEWGYQVTGASYLRWGRACGLASPFGNHSTFA